jgi:hypoxanthine phosphoribosyltransferase
MISIKWDEYKNDCIKLAKIIQENHNEDEIKHSAFISISRGGLIPSIIISNILKIKFSTIGISSYDDCRQQKQLEIYQSIPSSLYNIGIDNLIIIDDLVDSGNTLHFVERYLKITCMLKMKIFYYVVYNKDVYDTKLTPRFKFAKEMVKNEWIQFPYDI